MFLPKSRASFVIRLFSQSWNSRESRLLMLFMVLKFGFLAAEFLYGMWANAMCVLIDSFHNLYDCIALAISLFALTAKSLGQPSMQFSYGYARVGVLSAFGNSVLLLFLCVFLLFENLHRLTEGGEMHADFLAWIAMFGFALNIFGALVVGSMRTSPGASDKSNKRIVLVNSLTSSLGSVGIMATAFLRGWNLAFFGDTLFSAVIALICFYNYWPIVRSTGMVLLQTVSDKPGASTALYEALQSVEGIEGVLECTNEHFWALDVDGQCVGSVCVRVQHGVEEQSILDQARDILSEHVQQLTVQINKDPDPSLWLQHAKTEAHAEPV